MRRYKTFDSNEIVEYLSTLSQTKSLGWNHSARVKQSTNPYNNNNNNNYNDNE